MRASTHTFVAFVDIEKAFDTSWVEATLVRLYDIGVRGLGWNELSNFLRHTVSQVVRSVVGLGHCTREGPVPTPFNLLEVQLASPGVLLAWERSVSVHGSAVR